MHPTEHPIELLAPARDAVSGQRAIDCGADAVYIGPKRFGARAQAGNSVEDIHRLCEYAHRYWARVYVTLNTLLFDAEIDAAVALIHQVYQAGADALIIQDVGLLQCELPPIPLIASTQMHNHTVERVQFLQEIGLSRVILSRELSLEQIREIRRNTRVELECFIHGALCVGYSGQCFLSYSIGGRSGNRGECAQPCRRAYTLEDADGRVIATGKHLLSLKDLNATEHLDALVEAGISSFKIEGRLKDMAYVTNSVSHYRRLLDELIQRKALRRASSGISMPDFHPDLGKTFNRGYTDYFLAGRKKMAAMDAAGSVGEPLGKISQVGRDHFLLKKAHALSAGDGLCFLDVDRLWQGSYVNRVQDGRIYPDKMKGLTIGLELFRSHDHGFIRSLEKSRVYRTIRLRMSWREIPTGFSLEAADEDGISVSIEWQVEKQLAHNQEMAKQQIHEHLSRLGDTYFTCETLTIETDPCFFLPASGLNSLRRRMVQALVQERQRRFVRRTVTRQTGNLPYPEPLADFRANVLNHKAVEFYRSHGISHLVPGAETGRDLTGEIVMTARYCLRYELDLCGSRLAQRRFKEPLFLRDEQGNRFQLIFDCHSCHMHIQLKTKSQTFLPAT
ncbi:MAG TPA: U32 family peptidase [bacterium]|nr:U32 family peptidase [bacterium]HPN36475.1 U32 family peptidase [bacterium]